MSTQSRLIRLLLWIVFGIVIFAAYALSWKVTQPDFVKLIVASPKAKQILPQLMSPDLVRPRGDHQHNLPWHFPIPCGSAEPGVPATSGPKVSATPNCANLNAMFMLRGENLAPNAEVRIYWRLPDGKSLTAKRITTNASGAFSEQIQARPIAATKDGKPAILEAETSLPSRLYAPGADTKRCDQRHVCDHLHGAPGDHVRHHPGYPAELPGGPQYHLPRAQLGKAVYFITRSFLNIIRSYEPLVMATIFALIVGFGNPFAGVLALVIVTTASLGKMFSESVETIDSGPIEAITATGANRAQVILYGVVPQIIPDFLSFTIYHWDINVRISTIIGFVGGGGIGYFLSQAINTFAYHKAGTALLAIIIVVWMLDFLSSEVRKQLT